MISTQQAETLFNKIAALVNEQVTNVVFDGTFWEATLKRTNGKTLAPITVYIAAGKNNPDRFLSRDDTPMFNVKPGQIALYKKDKHIITMRMQIIPDKCWA